MSDFLKSTPKRFFLVNIETKKIEEYKGWGLPNESHTHKYVPSGDGKTSVYTKVYEVYEDTRYKAKMRLFNYYKFTKNGIEIPHAFRNY